MKLTHVTKAIYFAVCPTIEPADRYVPFEECVASLFSVDADEKVVFQVTRNGIEHLRVDADGTVTLHGLVVGKLFEEQALA